MTPDASITAPPMRIAMVITGLGIGGAETSVLAIAKAIDRRKYHLTFFCVYDEDNRLIPEFQANGNDVHVVPVFDYTRRYFRQYRMGGLLRLARLLRAGRFDIVQTHLPHANTVGRIAARLAGCRCTIATEHNTEIKTDWQIRWDRLLAPRTARIYCISESVKTFVLQQPGIRPDQCVVIHDGINAAEYRSSLSPAAARAAVGLPPEAQVVGSIGRLHPQKGYDLLLEACAQLAPQHPDLHLVLAGDGGERARLEGLAARLGLGDRVRFLGFRRDIATVLRAFDLFVLSSHYEGFGMVLIEAMAAGTPIISTDLDTSREILRDGESGVLVRPGDAGALAAAIGPLLGDTDRRAQFAAAAQRTVEQRFSDRAMVAGVERLYTELRGGGADGAAGR